MSQTTTIADVIRAALDARLIDLRVALPGKVESYDAAKQQADVKPLLKRAQRDLDGNEVVEELPVITAVPVVFSRAGGMMVTLPVQKGNTGEIIFTDWSLDQWQAKGGEVDPSDLRVHSLAGAYFRPGLSAQPDKLSDADADDLVMGNSGGVQIHVTPGGKVMLGEKSPTENIICGKTFREKQAQMHNNIMTKLGFLAGFITTAGSTLTAAGGSLTASGGTITAAGSDPIMNLLMPIAAASLQATGGTVVAAGASAASAGGALTSAVQSINEILAEINTFEGFASSYLSATTLTKT